MVANPNAAGPACGFQARGLVLAGATRSRVGLPNFPGRVRQALAVSANAVCLGAATNFTATLTPAAANTQYSWNFGDPASGSANTATGISARHRYDQPGSYTVAVVATSGGGSVTTQVTATVFAVPVFSLAPRARSLCAGTLLDANLGALPAGTTLRWQDGLTTAVRPVAASGRYVLTLTSAQGCAVRDSVEVRLVPSPSVRLGADTVLCAGQVPLVLNPGAQPAGSTYLWQDGSGSPTFAATAPGVYRVEVRNAAGCLARGTVTVLDQPCPVLIPNIITPNGDAQNQAFKPTGLAPAEWALVVFNRWGAEVFRQEKYANGWEAAGQSSGLYFYLLTNAKSGRIYRGWVEVKR